MGRRRRLGSAVELRQTEWVALDHRRLRWAPAPLRGWSWRIAVGTPVLEGDVEIIDCDFSEGGDGPADDVGGARLLARWKKGAA